MPWEPVGKIAEDYEDVYANWILGAGSRDFFVLNTGQVPFLLRETDPNRRRLVDGRERPGFRYEVGFFRVDEPDLLLREIRSEPPSLAEPARVTFGPPLRERSFTQGEPRPRLPPAEQRVRPGGVVVGVIDDGIAFAHERFRNADGTTRVEFVWIQDGDHAGFADPPYGREIAKHDRGGILGIDSLLAAATHVGAVDEDEVYRLAGALDFARPGREALALRASHGAHVMDLAAGFDPGTAPERPIVAVQLPVSTTADSSGASLTPFVWNGLQYILRRVADIGGGPGGGPLPVVVNLSYGLVAGPHDGTHELEQAIDDIVRPYNEAHPNAPLRVVIAAGNSHLARAHAEVAFAHAGESRTLNWRIQPDDRTPSFLEIWLPPGGPEPSRVAIKVTPPGGPESPLLGEDPNQVLQWLEAGGVLCEVAYFRVPTPTKRGMFLVAVQPTVRVDPPGAGEPVAPGGPWRVTIENQLLSAAEPVRAWVQRDDAPPGYPVRGRQSYLDHPCYRRFDEAGRPEEEDQPGCLQRRAGSINAIATGHETVTIGGFLRRELRAAPYSAGGPVTQPVLPPPLDRIGPDAVAPSDDSLAHDGVLAAGSRSGSVVAMNGTSVAAPQVARLIADELSAGRPGDRAAVQALAAASDATLPPLPPPPPPNERYGAGRLLLPPVVPLSR
jgi:subtilisin family serine protease